MNKKIDWASKLASRKFWVALVGFVTPLCIAFGVTENEAAQIASIIMAGGALIAYILGEGWVDVTRMYTTQVEEPTEEPKEEK